MQFRPNYDYDDVYDFPPQKQQGLQAVARKKTKKNVRGKEETLEYARGRTDAEAEEAAPLESEAVEAAKQKTEEEEAEAEEDFQSRFKILLNQLPYNNLELYIHMFLMLLYHLDIN